MVARKIPSRVAVTFIAALLAGAAAASVQAQSYQSPVTVLGHPDALTRVVPFGDLALATSSGQRALAHRVGKAVGEVCPNSSYMRSAYGFDYDSEDCVSFAWAGARPQIRHAIDHARSGQSVAMAIEVTGAAS